MKILLTRGKDDNESLKQNIIARLTNSGLLMQSATDENRYYTDLSFPSIELISFTKVDFDFSILSDYQNIILTSKYASRLIADNINYILSSVKEIKSNQINYLEQKANKIQFLLVGNSSREILQEKLDEIHELKHKGEFAENLNNSAEIAFCSEDINGLLQKLSLMISNLKDGTLTTDLNIAYCSADNITQELPEFIDRYIIYKTYYKNSFTEEEIDILKSGVDIIPIYSENCAKTLISLLDKYNLTKYIATSHIVAISSKVARVLGGYFCNIRAPKLPSMMMDEILVLIDKPK